MNNRQFYAIRQANEKRIRAICPTVTNESGIYTLTREDNGFKFAYVGQAKHLLERLASHLSGYQHIDLSIKKHGLWSADNLTGYDISFFRCNESELDFKEQEHIRFMAMQGYQLRNKTTGSQGEGKKSIGDYGRGGYLKGKQDGAVKATKDISNLIEKYTTGLTSKGGVVADRKTAELLQILKGVDE